MAAPEYQATWELQHDETGMLLSTKDISEVEMFQIEQLARLFRCTHAYGLFKYWQSWLQWEYQIDPIDYLDQLLEDLPSLTDKTWLPRLIDRDSPPFDVIHTHHSLREALRRQNAWAELYQELKAYTLMRYPAIPESPDMDLVLELQAALMPGQGRKWPQHLPLAHDFAAYYFEHRQDPHSPPLSSYPATVLEVNDPLGLSEEELHMGHRVKGRPAAVWELESLLLLGSSSERTLSLKHPV
jgi:hypothetical protein